MAETLGAAERLQPSLLDRLTDDAPDNPNETDAARVIDEQRLRQIVLRDLSWLFNTVNQRSVFDLERYPHVASSGLNYGVVDIAGSGNTTAKAVELQRGLKSAVKLFEPRVISETLEIELAEEEAHSQATIVLNIRGEIWAQPWPIELFMRTQLDVATGAISVRTQR